MKNVVLTAALAVLAAGCGRGVEEPSTTEATKDALQPTDPCRAIAGSACQANAACTWLDKGVDSCVSTFDLLHSDSPETLLALPTRYVTLRDLEKSPLTPEELTIAKVNSKEIYRSIMSKAGLIADDHVPYHTSTYCGTGTDGYLKITKYHTSFWVCGSPGCFYRVYKHYAFDWTYLHTASRSCG
jgi:hypothetical protein